MNHDRDGTWHADRIWWWVIIGAQAGLMLVPLSAAWKLSPDTGHGWAVPMLMAYLYWERWSERPTGGSARKISMVAWIFLGVGVVVALPLRLFLEPFPLWPAVLAAYVFVCAGLAAGTSWLAGGRVWLIWVARPMVVLLSAVLWPGIVQRSFIQPVRETLAVMSAEVLNLFGKPAIAFGTSLKLGTGWVGVDEACGGIRSLQAAVMIALFAGELVRLGWWRRGALLVIGVGAALFGNMCRTLFLAWEAAHSAEALQKAHDPAGWIALALTMAGVGGMAWWWSRKSAPVPSTQATVPIPTAENFRPVLRWASIGIVCLVAIEVGTRVWFSYGAAQHATLPQWSAHLPAERPGFRAEPLADVSRELLVPDHFEAGSWRDEQGELMSAYYIEWHGGQAARYVPFMHNPTICLPLAGCELRESLGQLEVHVGDLELPFFGYRFRRAGEEFQVYFAVWDTGRAIALGSSDDDNSLKNWWKYQWRDVREARRDQPAQLFTVVFYKERSPAEISRTLVDLLVRN